MLVVGNGFTCPTTCFLHIILCTTSYLLVATIPFCYVDSNCLSTSYLQLASSGTPLTIVNCFTLEQQDKEHLVAGIILKILLYKNKDLHNSDYWTQGSRILITMTRFATSKLSGVVFLRVRAPHRKKRYTVACTSTVL